jgi:hypothetical protein
MRQKQQLPQRKDRQNNSLRLPTRRESLMERHKEIKKGKWKNAKTSAGLNMRLSATLCDCLRLANSRESLMERYAKSDNLKNTLRLSATNAEKTKKKCSAGLYSRYRPVAEHYCFLGKN